LQIQVYNNNNNNNIRLLKIDKLQLNTEMLKVTYIVQTKLKEKHNQ